MDDWNRRIEEQHARQIATIADPAEALVHVGKENTELHEELGRVYGELDRYRQALTVIADGCSVDPARIAKTALMNSKRY
jgi:hypothetical protein